jgi:NAD(P)H-dependent flavin oxidoreductase YrpB (nitropropane dioxygenase family)
MKLPNLNIGNIMAKLPIIQGGMGVAISMADLAAAVANEGGIGVIATVGICYNEPDAFTNFVESNKRALRNEIRKARRLTKGILGVNILGAMTNYEDMVNTAIEEGIDVIISGAGLPLNLPRNRIQNKSDVKLIPIASSGRSAAIICKSWDNKYDCVPDAVIVEGPKAGGHLGFSREELSRMEEHSLDKLVTDVIAAVKPYSEKYGRKIPVIAAGGIYTGEDIAKFLELGCDGVQMATRFVATNECNADIKFKEAFISAKENDIVLIQSPVGLPGRAIKNKFLELVENGKKVPVKCAYHCLKTCKVEQSPYCIALALINAAKGKLENGFAFCGANAFRVKQIVSVKELVCELMTEAEMHFRGMVLKPAV